jgi:hypothetical protein
MTLIQSIFRETPSLGRALITLAAIEVGCLWLGTKAIEKKEYVLEQ